MRNRTIIEMLKKELKHLSRKLSNKQVQLPLSEYRKSKLNKLLKQI